MPLYELGSLRPTIDPTAWVAENAIITADVRIGARSSIWWNTVIRGDSDTILIGEETNIQDNSVLHTDKGIVMRIGPRVTVGHRVVLHGCTIGECAMIGMGSVIMNRATIGAQSIVGAGALIPEGKTYPDKVLIIGAPAKVVRPLTEEELAWLSSSAQHYVEYGQRYARECRPV